MMLNLTQDILNRPLTIRQWEVVNEIETFVDARFTEKLREAGEAREKADKAYIRTVAEVNADPRYQALLAMDTKALSESEYQRYRSELSAFEQRLCEAQKARVDATNRYDDLTIEQETAYAGTCLLAGEIAGFRMGIQAFASMLANPDRWGVTTERPAAALMVDLMTSDSHCLETVHTLMGDVVYNAAADAEVSTSEIGTQNNTVASDTV